MGPEHDKHQKDNAHRGKFMKVIVHFIRILPTKYFGYDQRQSERIFPADIYKTTEQSIKCACQYLISIYPTDLRPFY